MNRAFHIGGLVWFAAVLAAGTFGWDPLICAGIGAAVFAALLLKGRLPLWTYSAAAAFLRLYALAGGLSRAGRGARRALGRDAAGACGGDRPRGLRQLRPAVPHGGPRGDARGPFGRADSGERARRACGCPRRCGRMGVKAGGPRSGTGTPLGGRLPLPGDGLRRARRRGGAARRPAGGARRIPLGHPPKYPARASQRIRPSCSPRS